jgi:hypothetical protein
MIAYYSLGPLGLTVAVLGVWSLYNAWSRGRVRSHGWIKRDDEPKFFWTIVISTAFATVWFGLIGLFKTAELFGLVHS